MTTPGGSRPKILPDSQIKIDPSSDLRIRKIPEEQKRKDLAVARAQAQGLDDQALRRLALLIMEWGDTPRRREFARALLEWRAKLTASQARTLLLMAWEIQTGLERKAHARASHERVMAAIGTLSMGAADASRLSSSMAGDASRRCSSRFS